jgi:hypothetical protein
MYLPFFRKKNNTSCGVSIRLSALIVDTLVLLIIMIPINFLVNYFSKYSQELLSIATTLNDSNLAENTSENKDLALDLLLNQKIIFYMMFNLLIQVLCFYFYMVICWWKKQCTLGGYFFKMRVVDFSSKDKPSFFQANMRFIGSVLNFFTIGLGFFYLIINKNKRGLHDIISGTELIKLSKEK